MNLTKILFITTQLPYPPKSGGTVKSWNYVSHLAKNYSLTVASLLKDDDVKHVDAFKEKVSLERFMGKELLVKRNPINLLKSYFLSPCLNVFRNFSPAFRNSLNSLVSNYDIIIVDHYEVFQYVPKGFHGKVVMHTHNAEFMLWKRMSELSQNPIKKFILSLEAYRVKRYEKSIFRKSHLVFSTPSDIELYRQYGFDVSIHTTTYHLGNDQLLKLPDLQFEQTQKAITFIGTLGWEPNVDGLVWFIGKVWPTIKKKHPDCVLYILGKDPDSRIITATGNDQQIIFTGFIKNLEDYLSKTRVYIAPLRFGSGMKVKVLEGLYRGTPTVSTTVGAEGLAVSSGKEILIADKEDLFASHCIELIENKELWNSIRDSSRQVAKTNYKWQPLFERMNSRMKELL